MFHKFGNITDQFGNGLQGWQVDVYDGSSVVPIYSDEGVTGLASNRATSDALGNFDFYVAEGVYSLRYYDGGGNLRRSEQAVPMTGGSGVYVQAATPTSPRPYLWLKTDGSPRARLFIEDGI